MNVKSSQNKSEPTEPMKKTQTYTFEEALEASGVYFNETEFKDKLVADTFLKKYALRDKDENLIEKTPDEMHHRIASEFARIETGKFKTPMTHDEIFGYLDHFKKIIPQGSPMSGIGNKFQYVSLANCFAEGTKILTDKGLVNIEAVEIGMKTVTHKGEWKTISQIHKNALEDRTMFSMKCFGTPNIKVTDNHKFLSITEEQIGWGESPQWNSVELLRAGDFIAIPNIKSKGYSESIDINSIFPEDTYHYGEKDYEVYKSEDGIKLGTIYKDPQDKLGCKKVRVHNHWVKSTWKVDENFAYFLGLWYGDGCIFSENARKDGGKTGITRDRKNKKDTKIIGITFTFGGHEKELIEFVSDYGPKLLGVPANANYNKEQNTCQISFFSAIIGMAFEKLFGRRCDGKKMFSPAFVWPRNLVNALCQGLVDSDGCATKDGDLRVVLRNVELIEEFYHLLRAHNHNVGITYGVGGQKYAKLDFRHGSYFLMHCKKQYFDGRLERASKMSPSKFKVRTINGQTFVRIDKKFKIDSRNHKFVYTIGVEDDHSYAVEGLVSLNCFVVSSPKDSYSSIMMADQHLVQISKRRGGVGMDVTHLRPAGAAVNNAARTSTGVVSFMKRFSNSIREVGQSGRRGALLLSISIHHPETVILLPDGEKPTPIVIQADPENFMPEIRTTTEFYNPKAPDFATVKYNRKEVTGANVSIKLTDEFLEAVAKGTKFEQRWPVDSKTPIYSKMVDARRVWRKIIHAAWQMAEPGLLFWDHIIKESPADCYSAQGFSTESTNPCITGDTLVYVADGRGHVKIKDLASEERDLPVFCYDNTGKIVVRTMRNPRITGYKQPIYKLTLDDGSSVRTTKNHKFRLTNGEYKEVGDLKSGDSLKIITKYEAFIKGKNCFVLNHGLKSNTSEHKIIAKYNGKTSTLNEDFRTKQIQQYGLRKTLQIAIAQGYEAYIKGNSVVVKRECEECHEHYFVDYWHREVSFCSIECADSHCINQHRYKAKSKKTQELQLSVYTKLKFDLSRDPLLNEWESECKKHEVPFRLKTKHGFGKFKDLQKEASLHNHRVVSVVIDGYEDVYNGTVDEFHNFFIGGFLGLTANSKNKYCYLNNLQCGELPLSPGDSCRLIAMNLLSYVKEPYTTKAYFDYAEFEKDCMVGQRLGDDLIDLEIEAITKIITKIESDPEDEETKRVELNLWKQILSTCKQGRRTGTGSTALGDTLAALGIKYGSEESIKVSSKIYKTQKLACYRASVEMAKELGHFPVWDPKLEKDNPFLLRIKEEDPKLYADMQKYGRRNISLLTIAPGGTISMMTQTTSGVEPLILFTGQRKKKINPNDKNIKVDHIDQTGDAWQFFDMKHKPVEEWTKVTGETNIEKSPWWGCCAKDLNWKNRVKLQAEINTHIDHSISSTLTLPENISEDKVAEIYEEAWKSGCKGITIYRENCRSGVIVSKKEDTNCDKCDDANESIKQSIESRPIKIMTNSSPKRPKILKCDIYRTKVGKEEWLFFVGLWENGTPFEIFGGSPKGFKIPKKFTTGWIEKDGIKDGRTTYDLILGDLEDEEEKLVFENIAKRFEKYDKGTFTRCISLILRHGIAIKHLNEQLTKDPEGDLFSFSNAIARVLKKYIEEGEKSGLRCSNCGSENVIYRNGCPACQNCGHSSCS